jgi:hypothetical protein
MSPEALYAKIVASNSKNAPEAVKQSVVKVVGSESAGEGRIRVWMTITALSATGPRTQESSVILRESAKGWAVTNDGP